MTWFVTKTCHFFVFVYWRGTRKHFHWSKKYSYSSKILFGPMKMFSCPPSINKNKEVTSFCDKPNHLFLLQTNRTRLFFISLDPMRNQLDGKSKRWQETRNNEVLEYREKQTWNGLLMVAISQRLQFCLNSVLCEFVDFW